jgi:hypothetical protein
MPRQAQVVVAAMVVVSGCGSDPVGGSPATVATAQEFETAFQAALCDQLFRCDVASDDLIGARLLLGDRGTCARLFDSGSPPWNALRPAVAAGIVRYDAVAGARCITRLRSTCLPAEPNVEQLQQRCPDVFVGTVASGGSCRSDFECRADAWCSRAESPTGLVCPGICRARGALGATCDTGRGLCVQPVGTDTWSDCLPFGASTSCSTLRVVAAVAEGAPCGRVAVGGRPEFNVVSCQTGLWCSQRNSTGTCRRPIAIGAPCTNSDDVCVGGALCLRDPSKPRPVRET